MTGSDRPPDRRIKLRKYPNRRFYDVTRSQHATLEEIHRLVLEGYDIEVTDSKTGEDITPKILTQIILDHDPLKLTVFPTELLHKVIRANEPLVRDFVEKYFSQALAAFLESQRQFDGYLREAFGLEFPAGPANSWATMMLGPFAQAFLSGRPPELPCEREPRENVRRSPESRRHAGKPSQADPANGRRFAVSAAELQDQVEALRQQLDALQKDVERSRPD